MDRINFSADVDKEPLEFYEVSRHLVRGFPMMYEFVYALWLYVVHGKEKEKHSCF